MDIFETVALITAIIAAISGITALLHSTLNVGRSHGVLVNRLEQLEQDISNLPCVSNPNYSRDRGEESAVTRVTLDYMKVSIDNIDMRLKRLEESLSGYMQQMTVDVAMLKGRIERFVKEKEGK